MDILDLMGRTEQSTLMDRCYGTSVLVIGIHMSECCLVRDKQILCVYLSYSAAYIDQV